MTLKTFIVPAVLLLAASSFAQPAMDEQYLSWPAYSGDDLEMKVDAAGTHFTLWSPKADAAEVRIYDTDRNTPPVETLQMKRPVSGPRPPVPTATVPLLSISPRLTPRDGAQTKVRIPPTSPTR